MEHLDLFLVVGALGDLEGHLFNQFVGDVLAIEEVELGAYAAQNAAEGSRESTQAFVGSNPQCRDAAGLKLNPRLEPGIVRFVSAVHEAAIGTGRNWVRAH